MPQRTRPRERAGKTRPGTRERASQLPARPMRHAAGRATRLYRRTQTSRSKRRRRLALMAAFEGVDWPVALVVAVGHEPASRARGLGTKGRGLRNATDPRSGCTAYSS